MLLCTLLNCYNSQLKIMKKKTFLCDNIYTKMTNMLSHPGCTNFTSMNPPFKIKFYIVYSPFFAHFEICTAETEIFFSQKRLGILLKLIMY